MGSTTGGQWAILPAMVRYDPKLPPNAKLIYAEIAAKINEEGYCFAHNQYFAERFKLKPDTVSSLIKRLAEAGYIEVDLALQRGNYDKRRIYLTCKPYDFTGKISSEGIGFKPDTGKISDTVSDLNPIPLENNNIKINNPPIVPQKGDGAPPKKKRSREWKETAEHESERFEKFWKVYPHSHRGGRQPAIRAWDKLKPDEALLDEMAIGLDAQLKSREWKDGFGIPHASTWLNDHRWEGAADNAETPRPEPPPHDEGRKTTWI